MEAVDVHENERKHEHQVVDKDSEQPHQQTSS